MKHDPQPNPNENSTFEQVDDKEMYFEGQKVKYTGYLLNGKMYGKGSVRCLDNHYSEKETYEGDVYNDSKHGKGKVFTKIYGDTGPSIIKDEGEFRWDKKHGDFTKTTYKMKGGKQTQESIEYQRFSNDIPHGYSKTVKSNEVYAHQFKGEPVHDKDKEVYVRIKFENGKVFFIPSINHEGEEVEITPALSSTERKNGEEMDDK